MIRSDNPAAFGEICVEWNRMEYIQGLGNQELIPEEPGAHPLGLGAQRENKKLHTHRGGN